LLGEVGCEVDCIGCIGCIVVTGAPKGSSVGCIDIVAKAPLLGEVGRDVGCIGCIVVAEALRRSSVVCIDIVAKA